MVPVTRHVEVAPQQVWDVLSDGWLYPLWVVGASSIRAVDPGWPAPGTRIHHSVGAWPALVHDATVVVESEPGRLLGLRAKMWPAGSADVRIELEPEGDGTRLTLAEQVASGPIGLLPRPLYAPLLKARNVESARRLARLSERGAAHRGR
jgi:uncharacterized protein YndB with AHSA1/START domain